MKKIVFAFLAITLFTVNAQAQKVAPKKPTTKPKVIKKAVRETIEQRMLTGDEGANLMFAAGDTLVYEVNAGGNTYDFIVAIKTIDFYGKGFAFNYTMTNSRHTTGSVSVSAKAFDKSTSYINYFKGGPLTLTDACTVFCTAANFGDMPNKKTDMTIDGVTETFYRNENDNNPITIKLHGKDVVIDAFKISNNKEGDAKKEIVIQGISSSPLIVQMNLGFSITLKEVK
jgi:hypothetical protein